MTAPFWSFTVPAMRPVVCVCARTENDRANSANIAHSANAGSAGVPPANEPHASESRTKLLAFIITIPLHVRFRAPRSSQAGRRRLRCTRGAFLLRAKPGAAERPVAGLFA